MDAFAISVTNGLCVKHLRKSYALKMALCFGLAQAAMPLIGYTLGRTFASTLGAIGPYIAFAVLAFLGGKMIIESFKKGEESCDTGSEANLRTLTAMAIATSIDALVAGVTLALTNAETATLNIFESVSIVGAETFVICIVGALLGCFCGSRMKKGAEIFGGVILILIGAKILFESL